MSRTARFDAALERYARADQRCYGAPVTERARAHESSAFAAQLGGPDAVAVIRRDDEHRRRDQRDDFARCAAGDHARSLLERCVRSRP